MSRRVPLQPPATLQHPATLQPLSSQLDLEFCLPVTKGSKTEASPLTEGRSLPTPARNTAVKDPPPQSQNSPLTLRCDRLLTSASRTALSNGPEHVKCGPVPINRQPDRVQPHKLPGFHSDNTLDTVQCRAEHIGATHKSLFSRNALSTCNLAVCCACDVVRSRCRTAAGAWFAC